MNRVRPVYKCRRCGHILLGEIMQLSDRSLADLQDDIITMASPVVDPHNCDLVQKSYGVMEYVGFEVI